MTGDDSGEQPPTRTRQATECWTDGPGVVALDHLTAEWKPRSLGSLGNTVPYLNDV